jgi:hypothetical protein
VTVSFGEIASVPCSDAAREAAAHVGLPWYDSSTGMLPPALWWISATPFGVFPLLEAYAGGDNPGKTPLLSGEQDAPTRRLRDARDVEAIWRSRPWLNIGVAVNINRLLIIDIDPRHGGVDSIRRLAAEADVDLSDVPRQATPSADGGVHLWWSLPEDAPDVKKGAVMDGVDIPWQVPIAPSLRPVAVGVDHKGTPTMAYRPYTWAAGDPRRLPVAPTRLIDLLGELGRVKGRQASRATTVRFGGVASLNVAELLETGIPKGMQNNTVFALATSMARRSVDITEACGTIWRILQASPQDHRDPWTLPQVGEIVTRQYGWMTGQKEQELQQYRHIAQQFRATRR